MSAWFFICLLVGFLFGLAAFFVGVAVGRMGSKYPRGSVEKYQMQFPLLGLSIYLALDAKHPSDTIRIEEALKEKGADVIKDGSEAMLRIEGESSKFSTISVRFYRCGELLGGYHDEDNWSPTWIVERLIRTIERQDLVNQARETLFDTLKAKDLQLAKSQAALAELNGFLQQPGLSNTEVTEQVGVSGQ